MSASAQQFYTEVGEPFPEFEIIDIEGQVTNNNTIKGKNSLLIFFGTRCPPCLKELKELDLRIPKSWYQKFNIYAVDSTDDAGNLIRFNQKRNYKFKFLPDPNQELFDKVGDYTIPRTFLLNSKGIVLSQTVGFYKTPFENLMNKLHSMDGE